MNLLAGKDLKVTYLLGAGASFNAVPIWKEQGRTMIQIANHLTSELRNNLVNEFSGFLAEECVYEFLDDLKKFGFKAIEFGSIDIYAKRLYLIDDFKNLKRLKHCISVYFDLWENFYFSKFNKPDTSSYGVLDKRYYSLLSILLEKGKNGVPSLNENVNFITWNYDLQLENCLDSFLREKSKDYFSLNSLFNFYGDDIDKQRIVHLNGFRGVFDYKNKIVENVKNKNSIDEKTYLESLTDNLKESHNVNYQKTIKYAWESGSEPFARAKEILKSTNILVIIGYSFPAFNRFIDTELIKTFIHRKDKARVVYQDPNADIEIINILFDGIKTDFKVVLNDTNQFYIPDEILKPIKEKDVVFNLDGI